jgi:GH25 family lysozyme M1 (1,4-beta-N-acetylmuramidase)
MYQGIDVSSVQGAIDFNTVAAAGIQFVICKNYQGNDGADPTYTTNITNAANAGLAVASYNFVYPLPTDPNHPNRDPVGQANLHFNSTKTNLVCIDIEWPSPQDFLHWGINGQFISDWTLQYLETYTQLAGKQPLVYTYPYFAGAVNFSSQINQYGLWIASYVPNQPVIPAPWTSYVIWQSSGGTYKLPSGAPCDYDVAADISMF